MNDFVHPAGSADALDADITRALNDIAQGQAASSEQLLPLVYQQLRALAQQRMAGEREDHTLSATALVHEAYLRLVGPRDVPWAGRGHYYAAAAEAMRRILIDHARARATTKRGGMGGGAEDRASARRAALDLSCLPDLNTERDSAGMLILDEAISRLERVDADAAEVVRLKFFAGLTNEEVAEATGVSVPTVKRAWAFARGWLKTAIEEESA